MGISWKGCSLFQCSFKLFCYPKTKIKSFLSCFLVTSVNLFDVLIFEKFTNLGANRVLFLIFVITQIWKFPSDILEPFSVSVYLLFRIFIKPSLMCKGSRIILFWWTIGLCWTFLTLGHRFLAGLTFCL